MLIGFKKHDFYWKILVSCKLLSKTILIKNVSEIPLDCSQDSQTPNWIFDHS